MRPETFRSSQMKKSAPTAMTWIKQHTLNQRRYEKSEPMIGRQLDPQDPQNRVQQPVVNDFGHVSYLYGAATRQPLERSTVEVNRDTAPFGVLTGAGPLAGLIRTSS